MSQADHLAGPFSFSGKRLIIITIATAVSITILAYLSNFLHSLNFTVPASLFVQFIAILAAFTIFLDAIDSPFPAGGIVA